jgi:replicative DNA helicase
VNAWLRQLGVFGQRSNQKRVPRDVFRLANAQLAELLRHLWATDGSIYVDSGGGTVYYATNSAGLAADVAALLLRFGIVTRTVRIPQDPYEPSYNVHVSGAGDQRRFLDEIGAFGPRARPATDLRKALDRVVANTNVDTVPIEVFAQVRSLMKERGVTTRAMAQMRGTSYGGAAHFKFAPSRGVLASYAELLGSDDLREIASNDLYWDKVVSVAPYGEDEVFDLTVPATSAWLADGIVSHNSGSIEQDSDQVVMLWRDKEETTPGAPRLIKGSVAKNRNGPTGIFELYFEAEQARFFSRAREDDLPI